MPGDNPFEGTFDLPLSGEPFSGVLKGRVTDLDLIVPWDGAQGRIDYTADITAAAEETRVVVALDVAAPVMPLPGFAYAVTDFTSAMSFSDSALTITSIGGKLGGGGLSGSGKVGIGEGGIATMDLRLEGQDMVLSPMERMRAQADATLRLLKDDKRFVTEGEILFKRLTWRREIYEAFGFSIADRDGLLGAVVLRRHDAEHPSPGRRERGHREFPGPVRRPLQPDRDGRLGRAGAPRRHRPRQRRFLFPGPELPRHPRPPELHRSRQHEPYLDFRGETYVKDYRVTLSMSGPVSRLKPEFTSSPPLPPEEILSLLALGESFRRMYYSYAGDRSTALNTASLLTYQIADLAKKRTGGFLSLDRFRIDPYIPESAPGGIAARITVGKKVSKNVLVLYSTILANSSVRAEIDEVPIFRMEWDISRRFSLVGGRDDRGRLGFDVKFRKRF